MGVIVDTCVWSLALRRKASPGGDPATTPALMDLIRSGHAIMLGVVRQEILSGIREASQFERLRDKLRAFPDFVVISEDYETAAWYFNQCRARGIQGSNTDFLICAVAVRAGLPIFTVDQDFDRYNAHIRLRLYRPV